MWGPRRAKNSGRRWAMPLTIRDRMNCRGNRGNGAKSLPITTGSFKSLKFPSAMSADALGLGCQFKTRKQDFIFNTNVFANILAELLQAGI